jgi:hypothetical protein
MSSSKEGSKYTHTFRNFQGVNTQSNRGNIGDDEFSWLENVMPIGAGNLQVLYGTNSTTATWSGTANYIKGVNLGSDDYILIFTTGGAAYSFNLDTQVSTEFAPPGTFVNFGTAVAQWSNTEILIINQNGYFTYDGTTLTKQNGTVGSITIVSAGNGYTSVPTITISAPGGGGTTATATSDLQVVGGILISPGTGYQVNDVLTILGGTLGAEGAATFTVSAVNGSGQITGFNLSDPGDYTAIPSNPASVSGGFGTGATVSLNFGIGPITLTNAGSGYTSQPTATVSSPTYQGIPVISAVPSTLPSFTGTGYTPGDSLTVSGGTLGPGGAAVLEVTETNGSGAIGSVQITSVGGYTSVPSNPVSVTGGTGTGASFTLGFGSFTNANTGSVTVNLVVSPASGNCIATYAGRVWIASGRTISFSAPNSFTDFSVENAGGSFIMSDESLHSNILYLLSANDYLYIFGDASIDIISGVQVVSGSTVFSETNITSNIGVGSPNVVPGSQSILSVVPYFRSVAFATPYGFYLLSGTTPQKISDKLDGIFPLINVGGDIPISAGNVVLNGIQCLAYMFSYDDPNYGPRSLMAILSGKKWFFASEANDFQIMTTSLINGIPTLFATDGAGLWQLFANPEPTHTQTIQTKLWDMGDATRDKQVLKVGFESVTNNITSSLTGSVDINLYEPGGVPFTPLVAGGYYFTKQDVQTSGKYIGITVTGVAPQQIYNGFHLQYELRSSWGTSAVTAESPTDLVGVGGNAEITWTWEPVFGATSYNLYWSLTPGAGINGTQISGISGTTYVQTGLTNNQVYYAVVTAVVPNFLESAPSNQASAEPYVSFVYVTTHTSSHGIYQLQRSRTTGLLSDLSPSSLSNFGGVMAVSPDTLYAYFGNQYSGPGSGIEFFASSINTRLLTDEGGFPNTFTNGVTGICIHPSGGYLYVTDFNYIWQYSRNTSTGVCAVLSPERLNTSYSYGVVMHPSGNYLYIYTSFNGSAFTVNPYSINQTTGLLTALSAYNIATGNSSGSTVTSQILIHPSGNYLYTLDRTANTISQFSINVSTGALTALGTPTVATGNSPLGGTFDNTGAFFYATNSSDNTLNYYTCNTSTGELTYVGNIATGSAPAGVAVSHDNQSLYVANFSGASISQYSINQSTGVPTALSPSTLALDSGAQPSFLVAF